MGPLGHARNERGLRVLPRLCWLERLELEVRMDNAAARRCYERAGFQLEGVKRHAFFSDGAFCDVGIMSILRQEYRG